MRILLLSLPLLFGCSGKGTHEIPDTHADALVIDSGDPLAPDEVLDPPTTDVVEVEPMDAPDLTDTTDNLDEKDLGVVDLGEDMDASYDGTAHGDTAGDDAPGGDTSDDVPVASDTTPTQGPDFRFPGPEVVIESSANFQATSGCSLEYDLYQPQNSPMGTLVILAHGLECGREHVADTCRHLATWGLTVAAPDLCYSSVLDLDQEQNGFDMVELADAISAGPAIYVGHSAGGLAAFVAAASDADTVAMLGHDPTEWMGIGASVASDLDVPAYGLIGLPGSCNVLNNFVSVYGSAPQGRTLRVNEAGHCDFSNPQDCWACNAVCGGGTNNVLSDQEILETILGLSTAFLLWQSGLDATGQFWWVSGEVYYDELLALGAISEM